MRRVLPLVVALGTTAHAEPANVVVADVGLHVVGLGFQRTIAEHVALQVDAERYVPWTHETKFFDAQGLLVRARPFYYVTAAPRGIWISPFAQIGVATGTRAGMAEETGLAWAIGASVGYAWLVRDHVHLVIGAGVQYDAARIGDPDTKPSFKGPWPQVDGSLGYAF